MPAPPPPGEPQQYASSSLLPYESRLWRVPVSLHRLQLGIGGTARESTRFTASAVGAGTRGDLADDPPRGAEYPLVLVECGIVGGDRSRDDREALADETH